MTTTADRHSGSLLTDVIKVSPAPTPARALLTVAVTDSGGGTRVATLDGRVVGVAVWQEPGRYPMTARRQLAAFPRLLPMTVRLGRRAPEIQRLGAAVDSLFPTRPVRYLQALGVAPAEQNRGVGGRLVADGLSTADLAAEEVYLETSMHANVGYYEKQGFALVPTEGRCSPGVP